MDERLSEWRQKIETVGGFEGKRLASCALEFLASEHAEKAIALRWTELQLFGLFQGDIAVAARRRDTLGLIPAMIVGAQHSYSIMAIEPDRALLTTTGGATLVNRRRIPEESLSMPFWEHPAFRASAR